MNIEWNKNPLRTKITLDEHEKEIFRLKIKIEELIEDIGSASVDPKRQAWVMNPTPRHPEGHTLESLVAEVHKNYLDLEYIYGEDGDEHSLDKRVQTLLDHFLAELQDNHIGDCTCFPASCSKCHAESMLGIHTIKGLGKHSAHAIYAAFGKNDERTIDEAIEHLRNYVPTATWDGWEAHAERWKQENEVALNWLVNYKNEHFKENE